jgi:hypothetical protein
MSRKQYNFGHGYIRIPSEYNDGLESIDTDRAIEQSKQIWLNAGRDITGWTWLAFPCFDTDYVYTGMVLVVCIPNGTNIIEN